MQIPSPALFITKEDFNLWIIVSRKRHFCGDMSDCKVHPYGVLPPGNAFLATSEDLCVRDRGLGAFAVLRDDELLMEVLSFFSFREVAALNCCSRAMYVFSNHNELWRDLVLRSCKDNFWFHNSWKDTFARVHAKGNTHHTLHRPIKVKGIYSHALHRSWICRNIDLETECKDFLLDNIPRKNHGDLTCQEFVEDYEKQNKPVMISGVVNKWPAFKLWTRDYLSEKCGEFNFRATSATAAGAATFTMAQYIKYDMSRNSYL